MISLKELNDNVMMENAATGEFYDLRRTIRLFLTM